MSGFCLPLCLGSISVNTIQWRKVCVYNMVQMPKCSSETKATKCVCGAIGKKMDKRLWVCLKSSDDFTCFLHARELY